MEYIRFYILFFAIFYFMFGLINQNIKITSRLSNATGWFRGKSAITICLIVEIVLFYVGYLMIKNSIANSGDLLKDAILVTFIGILGLLTSYWLYNHDLST